MIWSSLQFPVLAAWRKCPMELKQLFLCHIVVHVPFLNLEHLCYALLCFGTVFPTCLASLPSLFTFYALSLLYPSFSKATLDKCFSFHSYSIKIAIKCLSSSTGTNRGSILLFSYLANLWSLWYFYQPWLTNKSVFAIRSMSLERTGC